MKKKESNLLFYVSLAFSRYGKIKLGARDSKPEFSTFSWIAMLSLLLLF